MSDSSDQRRSAGVHIDRHRYFVRKRRATPGINRRRDNNMPSKIPLGPILAALDFEHLTEIDVCQNSIAPLLRIFLQFNVGAVPDPVPKLGKFAGFNVTHPRSEERRVGKECLE